MKERQTKLGIVGSVDCGSEFGQRDGCRPVVGHKFDQPIRQFRVHDRLSIAAQQAEVREQRSLQEMHLREDVVLPTSLPGVSSRHGQFSLDNRPIQLRGGFHLHQPDQPVLHPNQKVGDDV